MIFYLLLMVFSVDKFSNLEQERPSFNVHIERLFSPVTGPRSTGDHHEDQKFIEGS